MWMLLYYLKRFHKGKTKIQREDQDVKDLRMWCVQYWYEGRCSRAVRWEPKLRFREQVKCCKDGQVEYLSSMQVV